MRHAEMVFGEQSHDEGLWGLLLWVRPQDSSTHRDNGQDQLRLALSGKPQAWAVTAHCDLLPVRGVCVQTELGL